MSISLVGYRVLIASPGDVEEEIKVITDVVNEWNTLHTVAEGVTLLAEHWKTHATPSVGSAQDVINRQFGDHCDIIVAVFWTKLGSPTANAESGTAEEIQRYLAANKTEAIIYFSGRHIDPNEFDADQFARLKEYKAKLYKIALCESFNDLPDLKSKLHRHLLQTVRHMKTRSAQNTIGGTDSDEEDGSERKHEESFKRAEYIREEFEKELRNDSFYNLKTKHAALAISITPLRHPAKALPFKDVLTLMKFFQPMGISSGCPLRHRPKSVTFGEVGETTPHNIVEVTSFGSVLVARNLAYGRDGMGPGAAIVAHIDQSKGWMLPMHNFHHHIIEGVQHYLTGLTEIGVKGPWYFGISILKMRGGLLTANGSFHNYSGQPIFNGDDMRADTILIPADTSADNVLREITPALDEIWRHNGYPSAPIYGDNGIRFER